MSRLESQVFLWLRRVYGGSCKTSSFRRLPRRLSCRFAWQAWHVVTFQPVLYRVESVKSAGSLARNARFSAPTCLVSSLWFSCGVAVSMGEAPHSTLYTLRSTLHNLHFTLLTPHSTLHTPHSKLHTPHSTLYTFHSTLHTPHFTLSTPHSTLYTLHSTLLTLHSTLHTLHHTPHSTLYTPHSTLHTLHSTLLTPHSTLHTPHSTLCTPHSTLYTLHSTLHTLHFTLHSSLHTPHSTLHTPHSTLHTPHSTLYTPNSTLYTLHSTLYTLHTLHSPLYTPHSLLYTPHSTLYTFHSTLQTGNRGNVYKTVQINYCRKVFCVTAYPCVSASVPFTYVWAFGFVGCILFVCFTEGIGWSLLSRVMYICNQGPKDVAKAHQPSMISRSLSQDTFAGEHSGFKAGCCEASIFDLLKEVTMIFFT